MSVRKRTVSRIGALLLALVMMLSLLPTSVLATGSEEDSTVVVACSDFQNKSCTETNHTPGVTAVEGILEEIKTGGYTKADGFICCGDYYYTGEGNTTASINGLNALSDCITANFGSNVDKVFVQGNHDGKISGIASTGANDADDYGVYVLNEDDYTAYGGSLSNSQTLAAGLTAYFNAKIEAGYNKPVFVVSHVPLHAGPRVAHDGTARYAEPIFDAINDAAKDLNIIFLFGHNHSKDHDAFLGGSAIYLEKGDTLYVANGSTTTFVEKTLNFTYMNAGYVGYYEDYSDADSTLTMTTFEIAGNEVTIRRYDANGSHVLKCAGAHTTYSYSNSDAANFKNIVSANTDTYDSPQTVAMAPAQTFTDDGTGISVTTKTGTGLTVSKLSNTATYPNIEKYELYDISVTGFTAGSKATVSIPVPNGYDAALTRVYYVNNGALVNMSATVSGGMATFVTDHFSQYMLAQADPAALEWVELPAVTEVKEVTALTGGEKIIIRCVRDDTLYVTNQVFTNSDKDTSMLRQVTGQENASVWTVIKNDDGTYYLQDVNGKYMTLGENTASVSNTATKLNIKWLSEYSKWEISRTESTTTTGYTYDDTTVRSSDNLQNYTNGSYYYKYNKNYYVVTNLKYKDKKWTITCGGNEYTVKDKRSITLYTRTETTSTNETTYYLNHYSRQAQAAGYTSTGSGSDGSRWTFYTKYASDAEWAALDGRNFRFMTSQFSTQAEVEAYIRSRIKVYTASDAQGTGKTETSAYTFSGTLTPTTESNGTLTVYYKGKSLGNISASFIDAQITDISVDKAGNVYVGSNARTETGSTLTVTYSDGTTETVPVNLGMVSGDYNSKKAGIYSGLTITYGNRTIPDYTLYVAVDPHLDPFPKSPNEGSVTLNKTATGIDFQNTGVAQVELSARGIPYEKGVDVIIMLDTSSSMKRESVTLGAGKVRYEVFAPSFQSLINSLQNSNSDIKVAIADFNGFNTYTSPNQPATSYSADLTNDLMSDGRTYEAENSGVLYTGSNAGAIGTADNLNASAFVDVDTVDSNALYNTLMTESTYKSGTNYDYAFWATYQLGAAIKSYNAANNQDRDLVVVFMTDGAPYQYNGYSSGASDYWCRWLDGTADGTSTSTNENDYLGALGDNTLHSYFFGGIGTYAQKHRWNEAVKGDPTQNYEVIDKLVNTAAGPNQYMTTVPGLGATVYSIGFALDDDGAVEKEHAQLVVKQMATSLAYCYENVTSKTQLDSAFNSIKGDIFEAASNAVYDDQMGAEYDLQMANFGPKNYSPTIEVVTYDIYKRSDYEAGTIPIDKVGSRKSSTPTVVEKITFSADGKAAYSSLIGNGTSNILNSDGLIVAKNFVYNTNTATSKTVTFNGKQITVGPERFYWNLGTVKETEYALRYYVYLTGSMEGKRDAGTYPTNDHATLNYVNYAGATVSQNAPIPELAWEAAVVYYAAYLVNEAGQPINAKGQVTGFSDRVIVVNPSEGDKVLFNSTVDVSATVAAAVIPSEYTLYDPNAVYTVTVNSGTQVGSWEITHEKTPQTTYVTGYAAGDVYSNATNDNDPSHTYTATTVWFAVKYTVGAIKDAVVIDYGLPVDISVLSNDMFYESGTLAAVGPQRNGTAHDADLATGFAGSYSAGYGTATVNGNYVRYQVKDMNMTASDTFSYAVNYQGNTSTQEGDKGYYYGQVTVIPATTIYYEDSFVTFNGNWTTEGTTDTTATQSEDRPGTTSVTTIDANNVYGMDGAYKNYTTYSLGSAHKATVTAGNPVTAEFSFTGTGFDVISLTDNTSGFITVKVTDKDGNAEKNLIVNNYFAKTGDISSLYQIPVMKVEGLPYGQHKVEIRVAYNSFADPEKHNSTTFILDAIRIYDPAGNDPTDVTVKNAYIADKEYKPVYETVRNMLVEAKTLGSTGENTTGICFVETKEQETDIASYANIGPNNECYLANGQAIAFSTTIGANTVASLQLGAKAPAGAGAKLNVQLKVGDSEVKTAEFEVNTATDLYYDLSKLVDLTNGGVYTFVISNTGSSLLSLTNFKTTTAATGNTAGAYSLAPVVNNDTVTFAKASMTRLFVAAPVVEEPTEPEIFTPDTFSAKLKKSSVKVGDKVTVTVTTSNDVESVTVNGEQVMTCRTDRKTGNLTWTYSFKATQAGESEVNVVAYDSNGTASEAIVETLTVRENVRASIVDKISNAIKKLFGWLAR